MAVARRIGADKADPPMAKAQQMRHRRLAADVIVHNHQRRRHIDQPFHLHHRNAGRACNGDVFSCDSVIEDHCVHPAFDQPQHRGVFAPGVRLQVDDQYLIALAHRAIFHRAGNLGEHRVYPDRRQQQPQSPCALRAQPTRYGIWPVAGLCQHLLHPDARRLRHVAALAQHAGHGGGGNLRSFCDLRQRCARWARIMHA